MLGYNVFLFRVDGIASGGSGLPMGLAGSSEGLSHQPEKRWGIFLILKEVTLLTSSKQVWCVYINYNPMKRVCLAEIIDSSSRFSGVTSYLYC